MRGISFSLYLHKHCLCLLSTAAADYPRLGAFKEWTDFLVLEAWEFRMKGPHPVRIFLSFCFVLLYVYVCAVYPCSQCMDAHACICLWRPRADMESSSIAHYFIH